MPGRRVVQAGASIAAALTLSAYAFGSWAVITVDDFPETVFAAEPTTVSFVVRQHGVTLLANLTPTVVATDGKTMITERAKAGAAGHYASRLIIPQAGTWTITINSGFMNAQSKLPPVHVLKPGTKPPPARMLADRGARLFVAKGCVTCHVHGAIEALGYKGYSVGPELTPKRYEADYLRRLLLDPSIARTPGQSNQMPALGLAEAEISALVAFINNDRRVAAQR